MGWEGGQVWRNRAQLVHRVCAALCHWECRQEPGVCPPPGPLAALTSPMWFFADPDVVSLEAADRPNFFLCVTANGSLELAKWQGSDAFHHHASFSLHQGTWQAGLVALESLAEPGSFLFVSGPVLALRPYEHTEVFRQGTLFRLLGRCPPCPHPCPLSPSLNCPSCPLPTLLPVVPEDRILTPLTWRGPVGATPETGGVLASVLVAQRAMDTVAGAPPASWVLPTPTV